MTMLETTRPRSTVHVQVPPQRQVVACEGINTTAPQSQQAERLRKRGGGRTGVLANVDSRRVARDVEQSLLIHWHAGQLKQPLLQRQQLGVAVDGHGQLRGDKTPRLVQLPTTSSNEQRPRTSGLNSSVWGSYMMILMVIASRSYGSHDASGSFVSNK
jgi:hypothetical protein